MRAESREGVRLTTEPAPESTSTQGAPRVIWCFSDGKAGHDNQTRGLVRALQARMPMRSHWLSCAPAMTSMVQWLRGNCPQGRGLPDPDLIIGAGHATHLPMLAARRARGGRVVVLMKPSLPRACFDLCIVPEHDRVAPGDRVLVTRGPLNALEPAAAKLERQGLILLGGPSGHHRWSDRDMLGHIETIAGQDTKWYWTIAGSRRTPESMERSLQALRLPNVTYVSARDTGPEWLPFRLAEAPRVWVSEDSMSMIYEALTAGAAVGILPVPRRRGSRVTRGLDRLIAQGLATEYAAWREGQTLRAPAEAFNEAARCAKWIDEQWLRAR